MYNKFFAGKQCLACLLFSLLSSYAFGQTSKYAATIEAGGIGGYGSVNVEYTLDSIGKLALTGRIGLSTYHLFDFKNSFNPDIIVPVSIHAAIGKRHQFIGGVGASFSSMPEQHASANQLQPDLAFHLNALFGYRLHAKNRNLFYSILFTPFKSPNHPVRVWGAISLGYAF